MQFGLIGNSELVNGCLLLCVSPVIGSWPITGCTRPLGRWHWRQPPRDPQGQTRIGDGWMSVARTGHSYLNKDGVKMIVEFNDPIYLMYD